MVCCPSKSCQSCLENKAGQSSLPGNLFDTWSKQRSYTQRHSSFYPSQCGAGSRRRHARKNLCTRSRGRHAEKAETEFTAHAMSVYEEFHYSTILAAFLRTYLTMVLSCLCLDSWKFLWFVPRHTPDLVGGMLMQSYPA